MTGATAKADNGAVVVMLGDRQLLRMAPEQAVTLLTELSFAINQCGRKVNVDTAFHPDGSKVT